MIILLSLKSFTALFSMELLIGNFKKFPLELGGGDVRRVRVRTQWGVVASVRVSMMEEGVKF